MDEQVTNGKGYIQDDIEGRPFFWLSVVFAVFSILSVLVVYWVYKGLSSHHDRNQADAPSRVVVTRVAPSEPQLQADPVADMVAMRAEQTALLESYGWVDRDNGVVRIPIDRAMAITLERSLVRAQDAPDGADQETQSEQP
jgi:hypothetical protein